jgi:hypothetical protein
MNCCVKWLSRPTPEISRRNDIIAFILLLISCLPAYLIAAPFALITVLVALIQLPFAENATLTFALMCMSSLFGLWSAPTEACACRGSADACMEIDGSVPDCHTTINFRIYLQITLALGVLLWMVNSSAYVVARRPRVAVLTISALLFAHTWIAYKQSHWFLGLYDSKEPFCRMPMQKCTVMVGGLICVALTIGAAICSSIRVLIDWYSTSSRSISTKKWKHR